MTASPTAPAPAASSNPLGDALPEGVAVLLGGVFRYVNPRFLALVGRTQALELLDQALLRVVLPEDRALALDLLQQALSGEPPLPRELRLLGAAESVVDVEVVLRPVTHAGQPAVLLLAREVAERRRMEEHLRRVDRMASVGTLAAAAAHQINNPLAAALGNLKFAGEQAEQLRKQLTALPLPPASLAGMLERLSGLVQTLEDTRDSSERIRSIVQDLKAAAEADDAAMGLVDVQRALEGSLKLVWNELRHRARLVREFQDVPLVLANETRLRQALSNLLLNASQTIQEGSAGQHALVVGLRAGEPGTVLVEVSVPGVQCSAAELQRLFERFRAREGERLAGLGLSVCQDLIGGMGGRLEVHSSVARGTVLTVELSAVQVPGSTSAGADAAPTRGRVLVVDDEMPILVLICRILCAEHEVVAVTKSREALECLAAGAQFDLILCDLMMPDTSGMDLYMELERRFPQLTSRMVFMTGGTFTPTGQHFLRTVSNPCLEKPFEETDLKRLVRTYLAVRPPVMPAHA